MFLKSPDGQSFSLHVERYEFPDEELGPTEDNPADEFGTGRFLIVTVNFCNSEGSWQAAGPEMDTLELAQLADWLDSILKGEPSRGGVYFTERNLEFSVSDDKRMLLIHASFDFLPPWTKDHSSTTILSFLIDEIDLQSALASLRSQMGAFPGRPGLA